MPSSYPQPCSPGSIRTAPGSCWDLTSPEGSGFLGCTSAPSEMAAFSPLNRSPSCRGDPLHGALPFILSQFPTAHAPPSQICPKPQLPTPLNPTPSPAIQPAEAPRPSTSRPPPPRPCPSLPPPRRRWRQGPIPLSRRALGSSHWTRWQSGTASNQ